MLFRSEVTGLYLDQRVPAHNVDDVPLDRYLGPVARRDVPALYGVVERTLVQVADLARLFMMLSALAAQFGPMSFLLVDDRVIFRERIRENSSARTRLHSGPRVRLRCWDHSAHGKLWPDVIVLDLFLSDTDYLTLVERLNQALLFPNSLR